MTRRIVLVITALIGAAGAAAGLSQATAPGANGRIAFQRYELHDAPLTAHIMVANSDGSAQQTLTSPAEGVEDDQPDWAPDGSHIVFQRCAGPCAIWTMRADGTGLSRLTPRCPAGVHTGPRCPDDSFPAYSPDGRHIAFTRFRSAKAGGQLVMVADSNLRHPRRVASGYEPGWSPDGTHLVFVAKPRSVQGVYVVAVNGAGRRRISPLRLQAGKHPDWSPDGARILFASGSLFRGNLFTIRPDGTDLRKLTHFRGQTKVSTGSYSPDGASIVFSTVVGAVNPPGATLTDVFVMTSDGTDIRPVTRARNWDGSADWGTAR